MHELSLAIALVEEAVKVAEQEKAHRVVRVSVVLGDLSGVEAEALSFCFPMAAEGTLLAGAELRIRRLAARVLCDDCGQESAPELPFLTCGQCQSNKVKIIQGREFMLQELEVG